VRIRLLSGKCKERGSLYKNKKLLKYKGHILLICKATLSSPLSADPSERGLLAVPPAPRFKRIFLKFI
jgi:hypothetical protein